MNRKEILEYIINADDSDLIARADSVRKKYCGDVVHIRGIIEFSNYCCRSCLYCGLRKPNKMLHRFRMDADDIVALARRIASQGVRTVVLQSGDDFWYSRPMICGIVERIKKETDMAVTLSIGERSFEDYRDFRKAGADRYLLKLETADEGLYQRLHPYQSFSQRLQILKQLKDLGYQVGTGNIVGLPGQEIEELCSDLLFLRDFQADMVSIGLFLPQGDTPLASCPAGDVSLAQKVFAVARIVSPASHMPVTTAMVTADPEGGLLRGLQWGANVIMPDFTPGSFRKDYRIYDNKAHITLEKARVALETAGRELAEGRGDSLLSHISSPKFA